MPSGIKGRPSHHFRMTFASSGINARGCTLSHAWAWGAEIACNLAFVTVLASEKSELKSASSMREDSERAGEVEHQIHFQQRWHLAD